MVGKTAGAYNYVEGATPIIPNEVGRLVHISYYWKMVRSKIKAKKIDIFRLSANTDSTCFLTLIIN